MKSKQIAELRRKARERFISRLNRTQQEQVNEFLGDAFEFSISDFRQEKQSKKAEAFSKMDWSKEK